MEINHERLLALPTLTIITPLSLSASTVPTMTVTDLVSAFDDTSSVDNDIAARELNRTSEELWGAIGAHSTLKVDNIIARMETPELRRKLVTKYCNKTMEPLHIAAIKGYTDIIALLLANGADINAQSADGKTALDYAQLMGKEEAVALLLECAAR